MADLALMPDRSPKREPERTVHSLPNTFPPLPLGKNPGYANHRGVAKQTPRRKDHGANYG